MRKRLPAIALLAVLALVAAACGGDDADADTTTTTAADGTTQATTTTMADEGGQLVMASILPLTGDLAAFGPAMENAVRLAVNEANAAGGVNGEQIAYLALDSGTAEQIAQDAANDAIAQGTAGVVGAAGSGISLSIIDLLVQSEVVQVSPSNTSAQFTTLADDGWYFRTAPSDALQGAFTAQLVEDSGASNVAVIYRQDSYGQGLFEAFEAAFGGTVVANAPYAPEAPDYDAEVTVLAQADPDAVVCICFPATGALIHNAAFEQGLLDLPWFYTDGMLDPTFPETAFPTDPSIVAGFQGTAPASPTGDAIEAFTANFEAEYGVEFTLFAPQSYDAAWLIILAAEMGDASGTSIRDNMAAASAGGQKCIGAGCLELAKSGTDFDYVGASGEIDFDSVGDPGTALYQIWQYTQDGDTEQVSTVGG
ncbi:MAG: ABC transporter substrate-binding protein [Acidimicrobiia bacterium]|nr:ABC transporter substrate-binding protein [Acidimicrobiia bacterium]NNF69688.1 ABC transporter substrate-binding protein [Acidimicrobiia bacterium]NNK92596.1 ABC transporter substrate-binding protein [Acidimicrobiia bacterium]